MGDERKVRSEIVRYFVRDLSKEGPRRDVYNLEVEFSKTQYNKNYIIPILFVVFMVISVLAYFIIDSISKSYQNVTIGQREFRDLSAEDIINSYYDVSLKLNSLKREIQFLRTIMDLKVNFERIKLSNELLILENRIDISPKVREIKKGELINSYLTRISNIIGVYQEGIRDKQSNINVLTKVLDDIKLQLSSLSPELLYSSRRTVDIEVNKLKKYYESIIKEISRGYEEQISYQQEFIPILFDVITFKYNPVISDPKILRVLEGYEEVKYDINSLYKLPLIDNVTSNFVGFIISNFTARKLLMSEISKIPFTNSMPAMLLKQEELFLSTLGYYHELMKHYLSYFTSANAVLMYKANSLEYFARNFLRSFPDFDGVVVDDRDVSNVVVVFRLGITNKTMDLHFYKPNSKLPYAKGTVTFVTNMYVLKDITFFTNQKVSIMDLVLISK